MTCTTPECGRATDMFLCMSCIVELDGLLKDVPFFHEQLSPTNQATKVIRNPGGEGGNGTHKAGSKPPTNLDATQLRANLEQLPARAYQAATQNPEAGHTLLLARNLITQAEQLTYGPKPAQPVDPQQARHRIAQIAPPLPTRQLIPWLKTNAQLTITRKDINNWAARGDLTPTKRDPLPHYNPHDVIAVHHQKRKPN